MNEKLEKVIGSKIKDVVKLHGDASYRTYSRVCLENGKTLIVMQLPAGKWSVSDEITNFSGTHKELPFVNVQRFLLSLGILVPKIIKFDETERVMVLEDLGDDLFVNHVVNITEDKRVEWYKKAIDLLIDLQLKTSTADKSTCVALQRSFDATLLNWEFDHFREYLIEARNGVWMEKGDRLVFEKLTRKITEDILKLPSSFVHRDFQSRNLMVQKNGSFALIDFQDALMGPCVYDLVALLRDSYVELEWETVQELISYYKKGSMFQGFNVSDGFNLVTIQRKMKDAGRFVFIDRVKKNPNFLKFIPSSLKYVKNALEQAKADELFGLLKKYVPEWK